MPSNRRGSALTLGLVLLMLTGISAIGVASFMPRYPKRQPAPPPAAGLVALTARLGLEPETLAASDVSVAEFRTSVATLRDYWSTNGNTLMAKDNAVIATGKAVSDLQSAIAAGRAPTSAQNDLVALQTQKQTALRERDSMLATAFQGATSELNPNQITTIQAIQRNRAWRLPTQMLVVDRQPNEWVTLQHAGAMTIDIHNPRFPTAGQQSPLDTDPAWTAASADPIVSAAAQRIQANGAALEAAWRAELMSQVQPHPVVTP